jgi:hypothetical protein
MEAKKVLKTFFKIFWRISAIILLYRHPGKTDDDAAAKGGKGLLLALILFLLPGPQASSVPA